jgi:DNA helicase-2/ATP-dependent DNA helicase PcrA
MLVDEFQDTNAIQYGFVRLLAGDTGQVFVVGDDDQAIYGWRGAKVENVQRSCAISPARAPSAWSRTTAPAPTSSTPPTR